MAAKWIGIGRGTILSREAAFSQPSDPTQIVEDQDGGVYPINTILVLLVPDATIHDAAAVAQAVGGRVVGIAPATNLFQIDIPTASIAELETLIAQLRIRTDLKVDGVFRDYLFPVSI